jgi:acetyltransferase-like isoleucine patch superfamily enzyme
MFLPRHVNQLFRAVFDRLELARYDRWTICKYFRRQGAQIGRNTSLAVLSLGTEPYLVKIGDHVTVSAGVIFATHEGGARILGEEIPNLQNFGPIILEDGCVIGQNVFLCPGIRVGKNSIVGANSVVTTDIPPDRIAMGVPARVIGSTDKFKEKCIERWNQQKPADVVVEQGADWWHSKHYDANRDKLRRHLLDLFKDQLGPDR